MKKYKKDNILTCYNCNATTTTELYPNGLCSKCNTKLEKKKSKSFDTFASNNYNFTENKGNLNTETLIKNIESKSTLIQRNSPTNFDLQKFFKDLNNNVKALDEVKSASWLKNKWNDLSGKNTKTIVNALDINNQFIHFSSIVYQALGQNAKELKENQDKLSAQNRKIIESNEKIDITDGKLHEAIVKFNQISDDMVKLNEFKDGLNSEINNMKSDVNFLKEDILSQVNQFKNDSENFIISIEQKVNTMNESIDSFISKSNENVNENKSEIEKNNIKFNDYKNRMELRNKWFLVILTILTISSIFTIYKILT